MRIKFAEMGKLQVKLVADVIFPNVELNKSALAFGHVLSTSTAHRYIVMKNSSKAAVNYKWYIRLPDQPGRPHLGHQAGEHHLIFGMNNSCFGSAT